MSDVKNRPRVVSCARFFCAVNPVARDRWWTWYAPVGAPQQLISNYLTFPIAAPAIEPPILSMVSSGRDSLWIMNR